MKNRLYLFLIPLIFILPGLLIAQDESDLVGQVIIFHAGSLTIPFEKIIDGFENEYPGVEVVKEIAGSRACARKITELNKLCDIMASADYTVIDNLLIPDHALWNIKFATNEMALVYRHQSRRSDEINEKNWFNILLDENINIGRSDPNTDPCGYRTVLTLKLAQIYEYERGKGEKNKETFLQIRMIEEMFKRHINDRMKNGLWSDSHLNNQKENIAEAFDIAIRTENLKNKNI